MRYVQLIYVQRKTWRLSHLCNQRLQLNTQRCWILSQSAIDSDRQGVGSQRSMWFTLINNITYSTSSMVYGVSEWSLLLKLSFILIKLWICQWIWHRLLSSLYKQEKWKHNSLIYNKDIIALYLWWLTGYKPVAVQRNHEFLVRFLFSFHPSRSWFTSNDNNRQCFLSKQNNSTEYMTPYICFERSLKCIMIGE